MRFFFNLNEHKFRYNNGWLAKSQLKRRANPSAKFVYSFSLRMVYIQSVPGVRFPRRNRTSRYTIKSVSFGWTVRRVKTQQNEFPMERTQYPLSPFNTPRLLPGISTPASTWRYNAILFLLISCPEWIPLAFDIYLYYTYYTYNVYTPYSRNISKREMSINANRGTHYATVYSTTLSIWRITSHQAQLVSNNNNNNECDFQVILCMRRY